MEPFAHVSKLLNCEVSVTNCVLCYSCDPEGFVFLSVYLSFIHLTVGGGSPTALQGRTMSRIQGVVTVPLKVRILEGAAQHKHTGSLTMWKWAWRNRSMVYIYLFISECIYNTAWVTAAFCSAVWISILNVLGWIWKKRESINHPDK